MQWKVDKYTVTWNQKKVCSQRRMDIFIIQLDVDLSTFTIHIESVTEYIA